MHKLSLVLVGALTLVATSCSSKPAAKDGAAADASDAATSDAGDAATSNASDAATSDSAPDVSLGFCSNDQLALPSGTLDCKSTLDAQIAAPVVTDPNAGPPVTGACGGYLVWLRDGLFYKFLCLYDPTTKMLVGAAQVTDTTIACSGAGTKISLSCATSTSYPDAGAGG